MKRMTVHPKLQDLINKLSATELFSGRTVEAQDVLYTYLNVRLFDKLPVEQPFEDRYIHIFGSSAPPMDRNSFFHQVFYPLRNEFTLAGLLLIMPDMYIANPETVIDILKLPVSRETRNTERLKDAIDAIHFARQIVLDQVSAANIIGKGAPGRTATPAAGNLQSPEAWLSDKVNYQLFMAVNFVEWRAKRIPCGKAVRSALTKLCSIYPDTRSRKFFAARSRGFASRSLYQIDGFSQAQITTLMKMDALDLLCFVDDTDGGNRFVEEYFHLAEWIDSNKVDSESNPERIIVYVDPSPFLVRKCCEHQNRLPKINFAVRDKQDYQLYEHSKLLDACPQFPVFLDDNKSVALQKLGISKSSINELVLNMPHKIATPEVITKEIATWAPWLSDDCSILLYMARPATKHETADMLVTRKQWLTLREVITLPNSLPWDDSEPKRKLLAQYIYRRGQQLLTPIVTLRHYSLLKLEDDKHYIYIGRTGDVDTPEENFASTLTLLQLLHQVWMKQKSRRKSTEVQLPLTSELFVHYNEYRDADGKVYRMDKFMGYLLGNKPHRIQATKVTTRSREKCSEALANLEHHLLSEYPFGYVSSVVDKQDAISIRNITAAACLQLLIDDGRVSLKTLYYLDDSLEKFVLSETNSSEDAGLLKEMLDTSIGYIGLHDANLESITTRIHENYDDETSDEKSSRMELLRLLFQAIVDKEYRPDNPIPEVEKKSSKRKRYRHQAVRSAMAIKSLTAKQFQQVYAFLEPMIDQREYLGAFIALVTGLHPTEIAPLTWDDWLTVSDYGFTQLRIWRTRSNKDEMIPLKRPYNYRLIPCGPLLESYLRAHKQRLPEAIQVNEKKTKDIPAPDEIPILFDPETELKLLPESWIKPERIRKVLRDAVESLNLDPDMMDIPEEEVAAKQTNLSDARGIIRSNYEFLARHQALLTEGELAAMLGRLPESVMARSYISYDADKSQYILYRKAIRIENLLSPIQTSAQQGAAPNVESLQVTRIQGKLIQHTMESKGSGVVHCSSRIQVPKGAEVRIRIKASHGITGLGLFSLISQGGKLP